MNMQLSVVDSPLCSKTKHQHYYLKSLSHQNLNKWTLPRLKNTEPKTRHKPPDWAIRLGIQAGTESNAPAKTSPTYEQT